MNPALIARFRASGRLASALCLLALGTAACGRRSMPAYPGDAPVTTTLRARCGEAPPAAQVLEVQVVGVRVPPDRTPGIYIDLLVRGATARRVPPLLAVIMEHLSDSRDVVHDPPKPIPLKGFIRLREADSVDREIVLLAPTYGDDVPEIRRKASGWRPPFATPIQIDDDDFAVPQVMVSGNECLLQAIRARTQEPVPLGAIVEVSLEGDWMEALRAGLPGPRAAEELRTLGPQRIVLGPPARCTVEAASGVR
ncbi:MAG: hypothetical protein U0625_04595 [Phycisphaerales bacterium]